MTTPEPFALRSQRLGCLPIVNFFLTRMGLAEHLQTYLPANDARLRLAPAAVIAVLVRNIVAGHRPVYALGEWAARYDPSVLGLGPGEAEPLNDDRVGRTLDRLFDGDRASLITKTVLGVLPRVQDRDRPTAQRLDDRHGDRRLPRRRRPTSRREGDVGYPPGPQQGLPARSEAVAVHPHDLSRWCGAHRLPRGGRQHSRRRHARPPVGRTARPGRPDFLYVADSKLCSKQAMGHIHSHGGRFVTIVPHGRREDTWFRNWAQTHAPAWTQARRAPGARQADPDRIWRTFEAPAPSVDGYRVIWVHSSSKAARDAQARAARIEAGLAAIDAVQARLASPKTRIKTKVAAEQAATTALQSAGATRWVGFTITETTEVDHRQHNRGRPGAQTRYRRTEKTVFTITAAIQADKVSYDAVTDGCFPTITNDTVMTGPEVLAAYHYQPNLERRNHLLKGPQEVAPVYLETAHRIEALLLCHFLAMLTEALIEREIRTSMSNQDLAGIPLYPKLRNCPAPSAPRILEIFDDVQRHQLLDNAGQILQTFQPELTDLQQQVLDLLHIPTSLYSSTDAR